MLKFPLIFLISVINLVHCDYWENRQQIINEEASLMMGSYINLTENEQRANEILMDFKRKEMDEGFADPLIFLPSRHFFQSRKKIEQSKVFKIIKELPKGASLHGHDTALLSDKKTFEFTYMENLYSCILDGPGTKLRFQFFKSIEAARKDHRCDWNLVKDLRKNNSSYDDFLKSKLTLVVAEPKKIYPDIDDVWTTFMDLFQTIEGLIAFKPVFQEYLYKALVELHEDNVMYMEFRGYLPTVYDLDGNYYQEEEVLALYKEVAEQFKVDFPDFHGVRFIYAPSRRVSNSTAENYVKIAKKLKSIYPDFVAGFDLVGQEDLGQPLDQFVTEIQQLPKDMKLFFHAGETNWYGSSTDLNLVDAILLGTSRIGHGFALFKHPVALEMVKQRSIAIEVCPISNQVLMLVDDLRNHPAATFIAKGFNVVIGSDDPSFWGSKALSYDWYMVFMGMTSREADIKVLKQLALNSILYSAMDQNEQNLALAKWEVTWNLFIQKIIQEHDSINSVTSTKKMFKSWKIH